MNAFSKNHHRRLRYEELESRQVLSAAPLPPGAPIVGFDSAVTTALPGDYNGNGVVGYGDRQIWKKSFGQTVPVAGQGADGNRDGVIDLGDYAVWRNGVGRSLEPVSKIELADGSFIVRRADADNVNSLIVPLGETVTLAPESNYDYIEVHGTLRVSRDYDTTFRFIDLIVFKGGELDMGTVDDPVLRDVDFIVKDVPINLDLDPYQFGNGIINFGEWHAYGQTVDQSWINLVQDAKAGDTKIVLANVPTGWDVGDELLIPDTAQIAGNVRREATVRIAAIAGNQITLDKPLDFEHLAVRDPNGNVRLMPYVANVTRNIVIRSENPDGTRGHTVQLQQSEADVRYASFLGLGRTLASPLGNAVVRSDGAVAPGSNQVARYAWHWHHVHPDHNSLPLEHPHGGHLVGNYFDGSDVGKWGIVIHGTSDMHVASNITNRFTGAGIVTEDGNEFRNVIEGNFATGSFGYGENVNSKQSMLQGIPGGEGAGFWFHSSENTIRNNVAVNNSIGYVMFNMFHPAGITPGVIPLEFSGNVALSNLGHGIEIWSTPLDFVVQNSVLANNGISQLFFGNGETASISLQNTLILAQGGTTVGINSSIGYAAAIEIQGGEILGTAVGTKSFIGHHVIVGTVLQNRVNFDWQEASGSAIPQIVIEDVLSLGLPGETPQHFRTGQFDPTQSFMTYSNNVGYRVLLKNWQRAGQNYVFFRPQADGSNPMANFQLAEDLTSAQAWALYGVAIDGGPIPPSAVRFDNSDGFVLRYTGEAPQLQLPTPKLVLMQPNPTSAYRISGNNFLQVRFEFTGAPADNSVIRYEIDGQLFTRNAQQGSNTTYFFLPPTDPMNLPGMHTVKTWRTLDGKVIAGSELEFTYFAPEFPSNEM